VRGMGKKKAKRTKTPLEKKKPRGGERVDAVGNLLIAWRIQDLDPEGGWGWQDVSRATVVERILYKLAHFETMTFPDIERAVKGSHNVSYDQLCRDAQKRLEERGLEDLDQLFSLRLSGKERIWGIREGNVLRILWWDPKHQVCPSLRE